MSTTNTASQKLQQISQRNLEMVQGNDEIYRAQTKTRNFTTRKLEPYILTNVTEMTMVIENKQEGTVYWTGIMTGGSPNIIVEDDTQGIYRIEVPKATTETIPVGVWNYNIIITTSSGMERTAVMGTMRVVDD